MSAPPVKFELHHMNFQVSNLLNHARVLSAIINKKLYLRLENKRIILAHDAFGLFSGNLKWSVDVSPT